MTVVGEGGRQICKLFYHRTIMFSSSSIMCKETVELPK